MVDGQRILMRVCWRQVCCYWMLCWRSVLTKPTHTRIMAGRSSQMQ